MCTIYGVLLHFTIFCCQISFFLQFTLFCRETSFGTIYAILRGEKFSQKLCPWRKNDKYEVWTHGTAANKCDQRQLVKLVNNFFSCQHIFSFSFMQLFLFLSRFFGFFHGIPTVFAFLHKVLGPFFLVLPSDGLVFLRHSDFPHCHSNSSQLQQLSFCQNTFPFHSSTQNLSQNYHSTTCIGKCSIIIDHNCSTLCLFRRHSSET